MKPLILGALALAAATATAAAQTCSATSPAHTVALVELYTSEGCSSCPPADQFLGSRRAAGLRADQAVLLSLHVDYWNDIGWIDPFSRAAFTARQRWLSNLAGTRTIYTPEFFIAGKELRNWDDGLQSAVQRINARPARAAIAVHAATPGAREWAVNVNAAAAPGSLLQLALVESSLASKVVRGENAGRTLRHDFVVRDWLAPVPVGADGKVSVARVLPLPPGAVRANLGISAFVQNAEGEVLQALALPACGA